MYWERPRTTCRETSYIYGGLTTALMRVMVADRCQLFMSPTVNDRTITRDAQLLRDYSELKDDFCTIFVQIGMLVPLKIGVVSLLVVAVGTSPHPPAGYTILMNWATI